MQAVVTLLGDLLLSLATRSGVSSRKGTVVLGSYSCFISRRMAAARIGGGWVEPSLVGFASVHR